MCVKLTCGPNYDVYFIIVEVDVFPIYCCYSILLGFLEKMFWVIPIDRSIVPQSNVQTWRKKIIFVMSFDKEEEVSCLQC